MTANNVTQKRWLTPAEMAERTHVSIDTLRYYEREGLLKPVDRAANGHRRYSPDDAQWVQVLRCLRDTNMSIEQLRTYCQLGEQGDDTAPERLDLLLLHREKVEAEIAQMREAITLIDHKIEYYNSVLQPGQRNNEKNNK